MVAPQPSKLVVRVRFPLPAPKVPAMNCTQSAEALILWGKRRHDFETPLSQGLAPSVFCWYFCWYGGAGPKGYQHIPLTDSVIGSTCPGRQNRQAQRRGRTPAARPAQRLAPLAPRLSLRRQAEDPHLGALSGNGPPGSPPQAFASESPPCRGARPVGGAGTREGKGPPDVCRSRLGIRGRATPARACSKDDCVTGVSRPPDGGGIRPAAHCGDQGLGDSVTPESR